MIKYPFGISFALMLPGCSVEPENVDVDDNQPHLYAYNRRIDQQGSVGEKVYNYTVQVEDHDSLMKFLMKPEEGFETTYNVSFENECPSTMTSYTGTYLMEPISKKQIDTIAVHKFFVLSHPDCLDENRDTMDCVTVLFFTRELGLVADLNQELISVDGKSGILPYLVEEIRKDVSFYMKKR